MGGFDTTNLTELVLPAMALAFMGYALPKVLALFWPEGVKWLLALGFVATVLMAVAGAAFFALLYARQGVDLRALYGTQGLGTLAHFGKLSLISALLWAPLLVLSVAGIPKTWVREVW